MADVIHSASFTRSRVYSHSRLIHTAGLAIANPDPNPNPNPVPIPNPSYG